MVSSETGFSTGLDLAILGAIVSIVGSYVRTVSTPPAGAGMGAVPADGLAELVLVRAAAEIPSAVGTVLLIAGVAMVVGGPLAFWVAWPLYRRVSA